jgi:hypothetical protein
MAKITISYRRDDSMDITGRIFDRLTSHYGRETVFRDIDNIPPGRDFRAHIRASIDESNVLMVVVGPHWMGRDPKGQPRIQADTDYVRIEVEAALNRHIAVIPLLVGGAAMPDPGQLPENIRDLAYQTAVEIDSGRDFDHHMSGLIRATDQILLGATPAQAGVGAATVKRRPSASEAKAARPPAPAGRAPVDNMLVPLVGAGMTVIGLMELAWFSSNLLAAWARGAVGLMFENPWHFADMAFGVGGLVSGIGILAGAQWARSAGIVLCVLIVASNVLWFSDYFDKGQSRVVPLGTALATVLAIIIAYLLLFRWPARAEGQ